MRIRVLVADDNRLFSEAIAALLESDARLEVVGSATNGAEAVDFARKLEPDVVLMDTYMPVMTGIEATERILAWLPQAKIIVLPPHASPEEAELAFAAGAADCVGKDELGLHLVNSVIALASATERETAASFLATGLPYT
jgi:DNA-binding NarL/FixJ family response regulator